MKKLLSILAGLAMTATTATTVVSCSWGCSSDKKSKDLTITKDGHVTYEYSTEVDGEIKDESALNKAYGVYDENGKQIPGAHITVVDGQCPLEKGKKYKFKVTYDIPGYKDPTYDGTKDHTDHVSKINSDGSKGDDVAKITIPKNGHSPKEDPDSGTMDPKVTMGDPKLTSDGNYVTDGHGNYEAKDKNGNKVYVDGNGHLVDTVSNPDIVKDPSSGFGKRIAGLDEDGKTPLKDSDGKIIYLDNDGYRIKYNSDTKEWDRYSADGKTPLGPDSKENSGNKAWEVNIGSDGKTPDSKAPYKTTDKDGKPVYVNADGQPVDQKTGEVIKNAPVISSSDNEKYTTTNKDADTKYNPTEVTRWTLNGNADVKLGSNVKKGSVVIGDNSDGSGIKDGTAVALNPSDSDSTQWHTISSGKYAGMKVRVDPDDPNKIDFEWPVTNKQINNIVSQDSSSKDSPIDKDGKVNLPIEYTTGKNGTGDHIKKDDQKVNIKTPWDADDQSSDSTNTNSSMRWWIDSTMTKKVLKYNDPATTARVYLSSSLANALKHADKNAIVNRNGGLGMINVPKFDNDLKVTITDKSGNDIDLSKVTVTTPDDVIKLINSMILSDDGMDYIEFKIKAANDGLNFDGSKPIATINFNSQEPVQDPVNKNDAAQSDQGFIPGAQAAKGTDTSLKIALTKIDDEINWKDASKVETIDDQNKVSFSIDEDKIAGDIDWSKDPQVLIKKKDAKAKDKTLADDEGEDVNTNGWLKDKGFKWDVDKTDPKKMTLSLDFADGKLDKSQYELITKFNVIDGDKNPDKKYGPVSAALTIDKANASVNEKSVSVGNDKTTFDGYNAEWNTFTVGNYVSHDKQDAIVEVKSAQSANTFTKFDASSYDMNWDGNKLSIKLNSVPSDNPYTVSVKFKLTKGFTGTTDEETLTVSKDSHKSIAWQQGQKDSLSFGNTKEVSFSIATDDSTAFNAKSIKDYSIKYINDNGTNIDENNLDLSVDNGEAIIKLKNEIGYQKDKLDFIITATDTARHVLNPEIVSVAKKDADKDSSIPAWKQNAVSSFDEHNVEFELNNADDLVDVDLSSIKIDKLVGAGNNDKKESDTLVNDKDFTYKFENNKLDINLKNEVYKDDYKFTSTWNLKNGYSGTTNTNGTAKKDTPFSEDFIINAKVKVIDGIAQNSLDNYHHAIYDVTTDNPEAVDLSNGDAVTAKLLKGNSNGIDSKYNATNHTIEVWVKNGQEIPGGDNDFVASFNADDTTFGYGKTKVNSQKFTAIKKEPTDGYTAVTWQNMTNKFVNFTIDRDKNDASYELDMDQMSKTGVDISTDKVASVKMLINPTGDWDKDAEILTATPDGFKAKDGTLVTYKDGKLNIHFTDEVMSDEKMHVNARQFKVGLAVGNGYENSTFAAANPNGFDGGVILKATKGFATKAERTIAISDINEVKNFNDTNSGTWHISHWNSELDDSDPKIKITSTKTGKDVPFDPNLPMDVKAPGSGGSSSDEATVDGTRKDPNRYINASVKDNNGGKDFTLSFPNGALWGDTYTVSVQFKLKNYEDNGEYTVPVELHFSKTAPKADGTETVVEASGAKWKPLEFDYGVGGVGGHLKVQLSFSKMGGCIDPTISPRVSIYGVGADPTGLGPKDWGANNRWYFMERKVDSDGNILFTFETWGLGNLGSYKHSVKKEGLIHPTYKQAYNAQIKVQFKTGGFGDSDYSKEIIFDEATDGLLH